MCGQVTAKRKRRQARQSNKYQAAKKGKPVTNQKGK